MFRRLSRFWAVWLDRCRHDVRCALRSIARSPIACAVAVISLAAGIGATTATLTLRNAIFASFDTPGWQAFAVPVLVVLAVGALATWIPARRAMRIDPAILLKAE